MKHITLCHLDMSLSDSILNFALEENFVILLVSLRRTIFTDKSSGCFAFGELLPFKLFNKQYDDGSCSTHKTKDLLDKVRDLPSYHQELVQEHTMKK